MATVNDSDPLRPLGVAATEKRSLLLWRECPLCGGTDVQETTGAGNTYGVVCGFCHCSISGYASREAANKRWNYRYHEHRKEGE